MMFEGSYILLSKLDGDTGMFDRHVIWNWVQDAWAYIGPDQEDEVSEIQELHRIGDLTRFSRTRCRI